MKDSQLSTSLAGVPQRFFELLPQWLAIDASLSLSRLYGKLPWWCSPDTYSRGIRILCQEHPLFSLGRCQGWLSKRLDAGSYSDGLLLFHPLLFVQLWGSYGEA